MFFSSDCGIDLMRPTEAVRKERVFLTGFMGSGKSTIGPILANTLGWSFVDLDHAIEDSAGRTINEIFGQGGGEGGFREIERQILRQLSTGRHTVVALGGGTIANEENFRLASKAGVLVYLKVPPDQLFLRLRKKTHRPMLAGQSDRLNDTDLQSRVVELYRLREPFYNMADVVVETGVLPVGQTVDEVVRKLLPLIG